MEPIHRQTTGPTPSGDTYLFFSVETTGERLVRESNLLADMAAMHMEAGSEEEHILRYAELADVVAGLAPIADMLNREPRGFHITTGTTQGN